MKNEDYLQIALLAGLGYFLLRSNNIKKVASDVGRFITGTSQDRDVIKETRSLQSRPIGAYASTPNFLKTPKIQIDMSGVSIKPAGVVDVAAAYPSNLESGSQIRLVATRSATGEYQNTAYKFRSGEGGNLAQRMLDNISIIPKQWIWG